MTLAEFKALVREQYCMLLIDEEAALAPSRRCCRTRSRSAAPPSRRCARCSSASGALGDAAAERLQRVAALFGLGPEPVTVVPRSADAPVARHPDRTEECLTDVADAQLEVRAPDRRRAATAPPAVTIVAHPCDETSLRGAVEAAAEPA